MRRISFATHRVPFGRPSLISYREVGGRFLTFDLLTFTRRVLLSVRIA